MKIKAAFIFMLFVGLVIRIFLVGNPGFEADITFWKSWSLAAVDHGIVWTSLNTNINYPPGFIYVLYLMGRIYSLMGNPHDYYDFWKMNNFAFLLASKSIAIIADIVVACLIYWFFSQKEKLVTLGSSFFSQKNVRGFLNIRNLPLILSGVFYLNPVVILDSALWGQVESYGIMFTIIAMILLFYKKPLFATAVFTVGPLMKLQNIIFIPIFFLFIYKYFDFRTIAKALGVALLIFCIVVSPFIIHNKMDQVLYLLTVNSDYFPWLSLNAHNLWWIVAGAQGMKVTDKITVLGIMNAKSVGLMLFSVSYLLSCILVFFKPTARNFILSLTFALFSFFLLSTQSHERYSYPVVVLLLFLYPFLNLKSGNWFQRLFSKKFDAEENSEKEPVSIFATNEFFWIFYLVFSVSVFFNIHTGLILNYPFNGLGLLTPITSPALTIANSYLSIALYFLFFPYIFSQISILLLPLLLVLLSGLLIKGNLDYLIKGEVSLTKFKPIISKQEYGYLQVNRTVNSIEGWKKWNRLSNNYYFYRKGFGTHANSNYVFDLNRKFRKFKFDYGVDTEAPTPASVIFQVHGDGRKLFESEKMGRFDFPKHAEIDVTDIKYLGLTVTDAGDGINSDHADWLNPIMYK